MGLQPLLQSTYRRYKEDEKVFSTWLTQAARACGYKTAGKPTAAEKSNAGIASTAPSQRLKGKARKQAKQSGVSSTTTTSEAPRPLPRVVEHTISIPELTKQANIITSFIQKKKPGFPADIEAALVRAIDGRQKCYEWYTKFGSDTVSDAGHLAFISILKDILGKLRTTQSKEPASKVDKSTVPPNLTNQFELLGVEDIEEEFPITAIDLESPSTQVAKEREIYEIEDIEAGQEEVFQLYCFFEDLQALHQHVLAAWQRFYDDKISLNVVSIITQTAIDIVKRLEADALTWTNPNHYPLANLTQVGIDLAKVGTSIGKQTPNIKGNQTSKHPYANIALPVLYSDAKARGEDPDELLASERILEIEPWQDFIHLPIFRTLLKFADVAHQAVSNDMHAWPIPIPPLRMSYIVRPDILDQPGYKEREDDDRLLSQLLLDIYLVDKGKNLFSRYNHDDRGIFHALPDEFAKSARKLWHKGTIDTATVFTCRLVLDVLKLQRSHRPAFVERLNEARDRADSELGFEKHNGAIDVGDYRWLKKDEPIIAALHQLIDVHIPNKIVPGLKKHMMLDCAFEKPGHSGSLNDLPPEIQGVIRQRMIERGEDPDDGPSEEHERNAQKLNIQMIEANEEHDFFHTHNPLHCGTLGLELVTKYEEAGVALANHHLTIFAAAHLYNAFQQLKLTNVRWPVMEQVIDLQCNALFANDIPKSPVDFYRRISYRTGLSRVSRNAARNKVTPFRVSMAGEAFQSLLESKGTVEHSLAQLENQIDGYIKAPDNIRRRPMKAPKGRRRQLNPLQMLSRFEEYLPLVLRDVEIDYISLTKTCTKLLTKIKDTVNDEFKFDLPPLRAEGDSNDYALLLMIVVVLDRVEQAWKVHRLSKSKEPFGGGVELNRTRLIFEEFFNAHVAPTL